ncbi:glyoxalase [Kribbella sp. ALI-6-A]|uniref:VOC family protein n=1 Tax=Kribbella sp. ALI-6-A TaxID=1933817 RepID=UPI00097CBB8E|nr:VOC family protein [Kribbella sp. ALI-6-A]ONI68294.1 glyoxalase [Kribbella sp. ALI-6-A]
MIPRHITVDAENPYQLATFWSQATGWPVSSDDAPGDDEVLIEAPAPIPGLLFIAVPESKAVKNRVHLDWVPEGRTRDEEVTRLLGLGATVHEDHRTPEGPGWVTLLDPEGNEFCVERSAAERGA